MSCEALIEEFTTWLENTTEAIPLNKRRVVQFTIAANQRRAQNWPYLVAADNLDAQFIGANIVVYGIGNLMGVPPFIHGRPDLALPVGGQPQLTGAGLLWFSDRRRVEAGRAWTPFDHASRDRIRLTINWPRTATIVFIEWGNSTYSFDLQCANDVMFGFVGDALYSITLAKHFIPL